MQYYIDAFKNYVNFQGRARRKEYWMFVLCNVIISFVIAFIANLIHVPALTSLYSLVVLCPSLALLVRRLHDIGKNWPWIFITFIPLVGAIWMIVLLCQDSAPGENTYGPNPKGL